MLYRLVPHQPFNIGQEWKSNTNHDGSHHGVLQWNLLQHLNGYAGKTSEPTKLEPRQQPGAASSFVFGDPATHVVSLKSTSWKNGLEFLIRKPRPCFKAFVRRAWRSATNCGRSWTKLQLLYITVEMLTVQTITIYSIWHFDISAFYTAESLTLGSTTRHSHGMGAPGLRRKNAYSRLWDPQQI